MKALLLAAGLGTRLRPLTDHAAKPSLPICGVPTLWYAAWHLKEELHPEAFAINFHHAPDSLKRAATDPDLVQFTGINFHFSDETGQILGSSGALWNLTQWIDRDTLAVTNADCVCFPSWKKMLEAHITNNAAITLHVRPFKCSEAYTQIRLDKTGRVKALRPKAKEGIMFTGSYFFEPCLLDRLPPGVSELPVTLLEPLIEEGRLYAYVEDTPWLDTGTVAAYEEAQKKLLELFPQAKTLVDVKAKK
jgi:NDP-sugar pyrophosphorylase family protein